MRTFLALVTSIDPAYVEGVLLTVLGVVGTYVVQFIKTRIGVGGRPALILNVVVSVALAVGVLFFTGSVTDLKELVGSSSLVFTLSTIAYRFLLAGENAVSDKQPATSQLPKQ